MNKITITADDFGLSRGITDTILETADKGVLTRVSILANGYAVDYALAEWKKRSEKLSLSVHLNLTEGKALSAFEEIPHLVDVRGMFRYSPFLLLLRSVIASPRTRSVLIKEVEHELAAQIEYIRTRAGEIDISVDGHQHVHMAPLVFSALLSLRRRYTIASVRIPYEPFFLDASSLRSYAGLGLLRHIVLNILSIKNRKKAGAHNLPYADFFIGTLMSGRLTLQNITKALSAGAARGLHSVEIGVHPGSALPGELETWHGDESWHYSPWRKNERMLLKSELFKDSIESFVRGELSHVPLLALKTGKFVLAGIVATVTNVGLLYICTEWLGIWYIVSAIIGFFFSTLVGFALQKFWAFSHRSVAQLGREVFLFISNNILGALFTLIGLYVLVEYAGLWYIAAEIILLAFVALWNFFFYHTLFSSDKI